MRLSERDKAILSDLERFRCLSRDDIAEIHFSGVKNGIKAANNTMLRLYRQELVSRSAHFEPFVYFPAESTMKKDSQKIPHFLKIVNAYRDFCRFETPSAFVVEPKYSKGLAEPDAFTIFKNSPLFVEIQRNTYSHKAMTEKIRRYESLYASGLLNNESWQPTGHTLFPAILLLTPTRYAISSPNFPIIQTASIDDFMRQQGIVTRESAMLKSKPLTIKLK